MSDHRVSFIGLIHACLDHARMDEDFGTRIAILNTRTALGETKPTQRGLAGVIARFVWIVVATRISGRYRNSQLFNSFGLPRIVPTILTPHELARLKDAD